MGETDCARCGGSAVDPEDSHSGTYLEGVYLEPPAEEPCRSCVLEQVVAPLKYKEDK